MTVQSMLVFAAALAVAVSIPGPGVLALLARSLGAGFRRSLPMVVGMALGDLVFLCLAMFGMATLAEVLGEFFFAVKLGAGAYLLYLGWKLWRTPAAAAEIHAKGAEPWWRMLLLGFTVTLGNPKVILFYLALLPTLVDLTLLAGTDYLILISINASVLLLILGSYAWLGGASRALLTSAKGLRWLNRGAGAVMMGAGASVAAS